VADVESALRDTPDKDDEDLTKVARVEETRELEAPPLHCPKPF
jgi:hypothetical protein